MKRLVYALPALLALAFGCHDSPPDLREKATDGAASQSEISPSQELGADFETSESADLDDTTASELDNDITTNLDNDITTNLDNDITTNLDADSELDIDSGPVPSTWLPLGTDKVRIPNPDRTGASLYRSAFDSDLVPLSSPRIRFSASQPERDPTPTVVRVCLDKLESLRPGFVTSRTLTRLAEPEVVTLVEGDILEIRTWAGNYTDAGQIIQGIELGGLAPETLLDNIVVEAATGGGAVTTFISPLVQKRTAWFGQRLDNGKHGGFLLRGTVRPPPDSAFWVVPVSAVVALSNQALDAERTIDLEQARGIYESLGINASFHQQGQYYGDYVGRVALAKGEARTIAAPGSWAYHGSDYLGNADPWEKQAAYWVTLRITLDPLSAADIAAGKTSPTTLLTTASSNYGDPRAVSIRTIAGNTTTFHDPGETIPWTSSMTILITFLGTSETMLELSAQ